MDSPIVTSTRTVFSVHVRRLVAAVVFAFAAPAFAGDWRGDIELETRWFAEDPLDPRQMGEGASISFTPEFNHESEDRRNLYTFRGFARIDSEDDERTHADVRELAWIHSQDTWETRIGIRKVFWGVTESQHLVDIINQTDLVENFDGEDKLGQPMLNLALIRDWGTLDFFVLPGFRERSFPGIEGRPRSELVVDTGLTTYESDAGDGRVDAAVRYSHTFGDIDLGLSHFHGTSRDPGFRPVSHADGSTVLAPHYAVIDQTGVDLQATKGSWLWKFEAIRRSGGDQRYWAATAGFEYTFFGAFESAVDVGVLFEYLYDSRGDAPGVPFEDDILIGTRLAFNDEQSTELLAGALFDVDGDARSVNVEASRRLGSSFRLGLEARLFSVDEKNDPLAAFRHDDYVQLTLGWFF